MFVLFLSMVTGTQKSWVLTIGIIFGNFGEKLSATYTSI